MISLYLFLLAAGQRSGAGWRYPICTEVWKTPEKTRAFVAYCR